MFKRKTVWICLCLLLVVNLVVLSSCASTEGEGGATDRDYSAGLKVVSAKPGGTFFVLTTGYADILSNALDRMSITIEASTGGSPQNVQLIQQEEADFGLVNLSDAADAFAGRAYFDKQTHPDIRAVFLLSSYKNTVHVAVKNDPSIKSYSDLDGLRVNANVAGGPHDLIARNLNEALGIEAKIQNMTTAEAVDRLKDGLVDAVLHGGGVPVPSFVDLMTTHSDQFKLISFTEEEVSKYMEKFPGVLPDVIPAKSYKGQDNDVNSFADTAMMVTHKDIPEDIVYNYTKAIFSDLEKVGAIHPSAVLVIDDAVNCSIPLHPGAIKYYEEVGITIPDQLR